MRAVERNISRHGNGTLYFVVRRQGQLVRRSLGTKDLSQARKRIREDGIKSLLGGCEPVAPTQRGFVEARVQPFAGDLDEHDRRLMLMSEGSRLMAKLGRKAVERYAKDWQSFSPIEVWNAYRQSRVGREITSGANHLRWYLGKLVSWAMERGLLASGVLDELKQIPKVKVPPRRIRVPEPELVNEFLQMIGTEDEQGASFLRFLGSSGLRRGAALGLTWRQVDFASGSLEVRQKGGRVRVLPMSAEAIEVLKSRRHLSRPWSFNQNDIDRLSRKMRKYAKGFDLDLVTYHAFRHYFASRALMAGLTVQEVADLLGHSDGGVLVLQTYGHICGARLKAAVSNLRLTTAS